MQMRKKLSLGASVATTAARNPGERYRQADATVLGIASLELVPGVTVHANLGGVRDTQANRSAALLLAAATWAPTPNTLLFAEVAGNSRSAVFGSVVRATGLRVWLVQDVWALDFTASRPVGQGASNRLGIGFGWYGSSVF